MQNMDCISVPIIWRDKKYVLEMSLDASFKQLGDELHKLTKVKEDTMRLFVPRISDKRCNLFFPFSDSHSCLTLRENFTTEGKFIRMMGVLEDEVNAVLQHAKVDLRIAGFAEEENRTRQLSKKSTLPKLQQAPYMFYDLRPLQIEGIELNPPVSEALKLMRSLVVDPGIAAIMKKHRWRVEMVTELAPIGYVGVSPTCILGLNKNHGEEISLRLRTDDLDGFRKYESIKKTLVHELAHIEFSEHDAKFYALEKQLNQEVVSLDWTKSTSHTLSGVESANFFQEDSGVEENTCCYRKLGGNTPSLLTNPRDSSVDAAHRRLADMRNCSESGAHEPHADEDELVMIGCAVGKCAENGKMFHDRGRIHDPETNSDASLDLNGSSSLQVDDEPDPDDEELKRIHDPVVAVRDNLNNAIAKLRAEVHPAEFAVALQTILKIIRNVMEHPHEMKFKRLRKENSLVKKAIADHKAAMDVLLLVGFHEEDCCSDIGSSQTYFVLKRNDPGLLWLASSYIEASLT